MRVSMLVGGVALAVLGGAPAFAADLPAPVYKAPVAAPAPFSWTGFYIGGAVGAKWADTTWTTTAIIDPAHPGETVDASSPKDFNPVGIRAGGYAGYNWQFAPQWVAGIEGDVAWADKTRSAAGVPGCALPVANSCVGSSGLIADPGPGVDTSSVRLGWDASVRARLGFLVTPQMLLYGTAGVAWQELKASATCQHSGPDPLCLAVTGNPFSTASNSTVRAGWTVGGGIEAVVYGNWLARAEYRFADFGTWNNTLDLSVPGASNFVQLHLKATTQIATVGLAYKF